MFLVNQAMVDVPIGTAALIVVLGMAVVFFGLILLMYVTKITGKIMQSREKKADVHTEAPAAVPAPAKAAAPGSAGEIKLHDVPDKTAAMLMASWPTSSASRSMSCASSRSARSRIDP